MSLIISTYKLYFLHVLVVLSLINGHTTRAQPSSCPSSCFCDENGVYVSCVGDSFGEFETSIPCIATRLEIRNYRIVTLSHHHFDCMIHLRELKLQQTNIASIANDTFSKLNKLERLDLSENQIETLSRSTFDGLHNSLLYLDLSSNYLSTIDEAFANLTNLEQLNLRDNRLSYLSINAFLGLVKVQYLNLDLNGITSIEYGTFIHLPHLAHLIICNNPLSQLSRIDSIGTRLQYIDMTNIGLSCVSPGLPQFVRDLRMARNNITQLSSGDFDNYPYLGLLVLDDNRIESIENDTLGRLQYLARLWINGNLLKMIPIDLPLSLKELFIQQNQIESIEDASLRGLYNLERLSLQRNRIRYLRRNVFSDLSSLRSLDLHSNRIENLTDEVFANLTKLEVLDLSENNLQLFEGRCFIDLQNLRVLHMSRVPTGDVIISENAFDPLKSIQTLEMYDSILLAGVILNSTRLLHSLRSLQEINIMQNGFVNLRSDLPSFFPHIRAVKMSGNNWHCDAAILWLTQWLHTANIQFYRINNVRCVSPEHLKFKSIALLTENDLSMPLTVPKSHSQFATTQSTNAPAINSSMPVPALAPISDFSNHSAIPVHASQTQSSELINQLNFTLRPKLRDTLIVPITSSFTQTTIASTSIVASSFEADTPLHDTTINDKHTAMTTNILELTSTAIVSHNLTKEEAEDVSTSTIGEFNTSVSISTTESSSAAAGISQHKLLLPLYTIMTERERHHDTSQVTKYHHQSSPTDPIDPFHRNIRIVRENKISQNQFTSFIVTISLLACFCFILAVISFSYPFFKFGKSCPTHGNGIGNGIGNDIDKRCGHLRRNSIQYSPQNDEISFFTVTEGTVRLKSESNCCIGNNFYLAIDGDPKTHFNQQAMFDSDYEELLPEESPKDHTSRW